MVSNLNIAGTMAAPRSVQSLPGKLVSFIDRYELVRMNINKIAAVQVKLDFCKRVESPAPEAMMVF